MTWLELVREREKLQFNGRALATELAEINAEVRRAQTQAATTGVYQSRQWWAEKQEQRRIKGRQHQRVQDSLSEVHARLKALQRLHTKGRRDSFLDCLLEVGPQLLGDSDWKEILSEAHRLQEERQRFIESEDIKP
jgi:hypothetical protein